MDRSSAETEYRVMALVTCELIWLKQIIQEIRFGNDEQMSFMRGSSILKWIVSSFKRRLPQDA